MSENCTFLFFGYMYICNQFNNKKKGQFDGKHNALLDETVDSAKNLPTTNQKGEKTTPA